MRTYTNLVSLAKTGQRRHGLESAVFHSVYRSREQRHRRRLAALLLMLKHTLRGLLFIWPLYLMVYAGFHVGTPVNVFLWTLGVPGIVISTSILIRGLREEYSNRVCGFIIKLGDIIRLLRARAD